MNTYLKSCVGESQSCHWTLTTTGDCPHQTDQGESGGDSGGMRQCRNHHQIGHLGHHYNDKMIIQCWHPNKTDCHYNDKYEQLLSTTMINMTSQLWNLDMSSRIVTTMLT